MKSAMRCFYCNRPITTIMGYVQRTWVNRGDTVERLRQPDTAHIHCALPAKTGGWLPGYRNTINGPPDAPHVRQMVRTILNHLDNTRDLFDDIRQSR